MSEEARELIALLIEVPNGDPTLERAIRVLLESAAVTGRHNAQAAREAGLTKLARAYDYAAVALTHVRTEERRVVVVEGREEHGPVTDTA